ncbi:hypothetical protein N7540_008558 [Penicillium herquei]|nr:hypothetical protein N7540_008558 [Penicillium herquei]
MVRYGSATQTKKRRSSSRVDKKQKLKKKRYLETKVNTVDKWEKQNDEQSMEDKIFNSSIQVKDLDLDVSYVGKIKLPPPTKQPERKRWINNGEIINNSQDVPRGWTSAESDLDPEDCDAQIARCKERIQDKIMPVIFEDRLKEFEKLKISQEERKQKYPGLEWAVVKRLECLTLLQECLEGTKEGMAGEDKYSFEQLVNVKALIKAYKSKALALTPGLVTYWWKGVQHSQPRPLKWEEFFALWRESGSGKSFWVEGVDLTLRIPGSRQTMDYEFMHDMGSKIMVDFTDDINILQGMDLTAGIPITHVAFHGTLIMHTVSGHSAVNVYTMMVNVRDGNNGELMNQNWHPVQIALVQGSRENNVWSHPRLDGPWLH